jgi:hypothetical protein
MAKSKDNKGISFTLSDDHVKALRTIAGDRSVRLAGKLRGSTVDVEFIACNAPFAACNSAFTSCNSAFSSCNSAFSSCNSAFSAKKK